MKTVWSWWLLGVAALSLLLARDAGWRLPDRLDPWAPLVVADAPNLLTAMKLARLSGDGAACRSVLEATPFRFDAVPDRDPSEGCGWRDAVRIRATDLRVETPFVLACPAAVSLALWERHVVAPAAKRWLGQPVVGLVHAGSYACRAVRGTGRADPGLSRHATAEAIDVAGFVTADGRRFEIGRGWHRGPVVEQQFLREVHAGACAWFDEVLGPDYNAAHAAHFHLDRGAGRVCR